MKKGGIAVMYRLLKPKPKVGTINGLANSGTIASMTKSFSELVTHAAKRYCDHLVRATHPE